MSVIEADEFACFDDYGHLTDADFAAIDASTVRDLGSPNIPIELEEHTNTTPPTPGPSTVRPRDIFRRRTGSLSVSDLVSPSWCEYQFEYRLRHQKFRRLGGRQDSFVSASGNEINVELNTVKKRKEVTKAGRDVHKVLEKQIRPTEPVIIRVDTQEERWAVRLVDMISCIHDILEEGYTREFGVFGVIHSQPIYGLIDEVQRECHPGPSGETLFCLRVSDTKSRETRSLPPEPDTFGSRMQLMIYHQLLVALLATSPPYDFLPFWTSIDLDPRAPFSDYFIQQIFAGSRIEGETVTCLQDLTDLWSALVSVLNISEVDKTLEIVYRLRKQPWHHPRKWVDIPETESEIREMFVEAEETTVATLPEIVGRTRFPLDRDLLDSFLTDILAWWDGERPPRGVSLEQTKRCFKCEFNGDCEWRKEKAKQANMFDT